MTRNTFCPFCGNLTKEGDDFCNNCGASIEKPAKKLSSDYTNDKQPTFSTQQPTYTTRPQPQNQQQTYQYGSQTVYQQSSTYIPEAKNKSAELAFVFGIIGLIFFPMAIAAIILGFLGLQKQSARNKAILGIILGFCSVGGYIIFFLL